MGDVPTSCIILWDEDVSLPMCIEHLYVILSSMRVAVCVPLIVLVISRIYNGSVGN